jgi:hypothetical protein
MAYGNDILFMNIFSSLQLLHISIAFVLCHIWLNFWFQNNGNLFITTLISRTCDELNADG